MTLRLHYNVFPSANLDKLFLVCFLFIAGHAYAQPGIEYDKIHDKTFDMRATRIATRDGGFLIFGTVLYNINYHIAKYNAAAALEWEKTYQGNQSDFLTSVIQTSDGGYLLGGDSNSTKGLDKSENTFDEDEYGSRDYWIIKISADGTKQWDRTLGGAKAEKLTSLLQTSDGEYLIGGYSDSPVSAVKTEPAILFDLDYENDYSNDYWVVKLTSSGAVKWDKTIGGNKEEYLSAMLPAPDGGYLLAGSSSSGIGHDKVTDNRGGLDYWIVKITSAGVKVSEKVFGGSNSDSVVGFEPTADGGFILGGNSVSEPSGDKTSQHFGPADYPDYWLVKVNAALDKQWDRTLGGSGYDVLVSIKQTLDGGYIIGGNSQSEPGGTRTAKRKGEQDIWIVKTNADGVSLWDKSLADAETYGTIISVDPVSDGGYLVQALSDSDLPSGDKTSRGTGLWEIKLLADFNHNKLSFSKTALAFTLLPYAPKPATPQSINLSANAGNPAVSFVKNAPDTWVLLPAPALGALPVSVDGSKFRPGNYNATVTAIAPGYERAILPISLLTADNYTPPILLSIGNMVLIEKRPLTFTAIADVRPGQTKLFSLENAPEGATNHQCVNRRVHVVACHGRCLQVYGKSYRKHFPALDRRRRNYGHSTQRNSKRYCQDQCRRRGLYNAGRQTIYSRSVFLWRGPDQLQ